MLRVKNNQSCQNGRQFLLLAIVTWLLASACGSSNDRIGDVTAPYELPPFLVSPPALSSVPFGSRGVAVFPQPGALKGTLLLELSSEPGAEVFYGFESQAELEKANVGSDLPASPSKYLIPLSLRPPVSLWAQASKDGTAGPRVKLEYSFAPEAMPPLDLSAAVRLPYPVPDFQPINNSLSFENLPVSEEASDGSAPVLDGLSADWSRKGRLYLVDSVYDVPLELGHIDVVWAQVKETADAIYVAIATQNPPRTAPKSFYAFEIGTSGVSLASFGGGAQYRYRVEVSESGIKLTNRSTGEELKASAATSFAIKDIVEIKVSKGDVPDLAAASELALRVQAGDWSTGTTVIDRVEPVFLRSKFEINRYSFQLSPNRSVDLNFHVDPSLGQKRFVQDNLSLMRLFMGELEQANGISFYNTGSLPVFFVPKEESGYAGLNTTDRGMLTTLGPATSLIAKAQLHAHELAHFQNARFSELKGRWLQEGMSEWSAERLLYRHFPVRAVHRFMRKLRYDYYFTSVATQKDELALSNWGEEVTPIGYEKSLMFFNILEMRVGQNVLRKAFQRSVNQTMDTEKFRRFLEQESGQDLSEVFRFWVTPGEPASGLEPEYLFRDPDGDGLFTIDELVLGTNPNLFDTNGDGFGDGEAYFRRFDLKTRLSPLPDDGNTPVLVTNLTTDSAELLRLGGVPNAKHYYSLNPFNEAPTKLFKDPLFLRPPYTVAVRSEFGGKMGPKRLLSRDLYLKGNKVAVTFENTGILPPQARTSAFVKPNLTRGSAVAVGAGALQALDSSDDLPAFLSSYDIVEVSQETRADQLVIKVRHRDKPSQYGEYGDYTVMFDVISWTDGTPQVSRQHGIVISQGVVSFVDYKKGVETVTPVYQGVEVSYGNELIVTLDKKMLSNWINSTAERLICAINQIQLEGDAKTRDRAGCIIYESNEYVRRAGAIDSVFPTSGHTIELLTKQNTFSENLASSSLEIGLASLKEFEKLTGRPWLERSIWPFHLEARSSNSSSTLGLATIRAGASLAYRPNLDAAGFQYLFVEQLARLHMADLLDRNSSSAPYWIQELYIQWLTSSALYRLVPSVNVHGFHASRLSDYIGYVDGTPGYETVFSNEIPLREWNDTTLSSTGSVKSLILALVLDAKFGTEVMGRVFSHFPNEVPDSQTLKALVKGYAPANQSQAIDDLWQAFVEGSGNSAVDTAVIRHMLEDQDGDGLFKFEEDKLGTSDLVSTPYF